MSCGQKQSVLQLSQVRRVLCMHQCMGVLMGRLFAARCEAHCGYLALVLETLLHLLLIQLDPCTAFCSRWKPRHHPEQQLQGIISLSAPPLRQPTLALWQSSPGTRALPNHLLHTFSLRLHREQCAVLWQSPRVFSSRLSSPPPQLYSFASADTMCSSLLFPPPPLTPSAIHLYFNNLH